LTGEWTVLHRPYGELLLLKLALFMLLMLPAAYNKWRLAPALGSAASNAVTALRRTITAELLLIAIVLTVTATLTTLYSPHGPDEPPASAATVTASV
jgi:copper resistance protein D